MPDSAPVASASDRVEPTSSRPPVLALARRTWLGAALFVCTAAFALGFDALHTPERAATAGLILAVGIVLCSVISLAAALVPRWIRAVLALIGPLLPISVGVYCALVGATLESSTAALSLFLIGTALMRPGIAVQLMMTLGAAIGYLATASVTLAATPIAYTAPVLGVVATIAVLALLWQHRRAPVSAAQSASYISMQQQHGRATALLASNNALSTATRDFGLLVDTAVDQTRLLLDADWTVLWQRGDTDAFHVAAVSGLPAALAETVNRHVLAPAGVAALYERIAQQPALTLAERDAKRLVPLDTVAPILKHAVVSAVRAQTQVVGILFAGYATRGTRGPHDAESLLAGIAEQLGIALRNATLIGDAQAANRAKSEFIATMSHELRTPINVVMGYADLLIEGAFGDATQDQLDVLNRMRHQSAQLLDLVQPMLDLNRLEARQTSIARDAFRITDLIESLQLTVPASWCKPGVALLWEVPLDSNVVMHSDRGKIEMIVRNLIHNALKYTDHGEVAVCIDSETTAGYVAIVVRDTGTGIAANDLPMLFEMFGQSNSDLPRDGGVGLGLYIVKRLTDVLGGRVSVESVRGRGSTFTVTLPVDVPLPA